MVGLGWQSNRWVLFGAKGLRGGAMCGAGREALEGKLEEGSLFHKEHRKTGCLKKKTILKYSQNAILKKDACLPVNFDRVGFSRGDFNVTNGLDMPWGRYKVIRFSPKATATAWVRLTESNLFLALLI